MWTHVDRPSAVLAGSLGAIALLVACSGDTPTGTGDDRASLEQSPAGSYALCHRSGGPGTIIRVTASELSDHLNHGDYLTTLYVEHGDTQPDDGAHFHRIGDALAAARAGRLGRGELRSGACRITISVGTGVFQGSALRAPTARIDHFPFVVDVPDITLQGTLVMKLDANGRATGTGVGLRQTTLRAADPQPFIDEISEPIIIANGHPGGSAGNGLTIEGFVFESGHHNFEIDFGGQAVFASRVNRLIIRGNRIDEGFSESIDLRESEALLERNHLYGTGGTCDICLAGPGSYRATGNVLLAGGIPGFLLVSAIGTPPPTGIEPTVLPFASTVYGEITNNEVQDHRRLPVGAGIRVGALGVGASEVHGTVHAVIRNNELVNNTFAMLIEAAFPAPDTDLRGDVDVTLGGNTMRESCQNDLLVALTRHTTALGLTDFPYLEHSTYRLTLNGNIAWSEVWYGNEGGHGNRLVVDGRLIPSGTRAFYDETTCPGIEGTSDQ
jgi:hypothetical protein